MPNDGDSKNPEVAAVADEIARYMRERGNAADTLEGIVHWWLLRQRLYEGHRLVESAMELLCRNGAIERRELADGSVVYRAAGSDSGPDGNF